MTTPYNQETAFNLNTIFTIIVCGQVYNISWKSLVSDGPNNFFTRHFTKSNSRIIHIDRNPDTFKYIIRHLRGYPIIAKNECQHQDFLNDAQYYGLKKLSYLLKQFVYLNIGGTSFRLRWDLFERDGPYNYFTGPLKHALLSPHPTLGESAPISIERDPEIFKDMVRHLQGYSIHIRDEQHKSQLLSDAQFYLFKKLRDKLKSSSIHKEEHQSEILVKIADIKQSQIEVGEDGLVYYKQEDQKKSFLLTVQLDDLNICCHRNTNLNIDCTFLLETDLKIKNSQWVISNSVTFDRDCAIINGENEFGLLDYKQEINLNQSGWKTCQVHPDCEINWIGIEKAIAKTHSTLKQKELCISFAKILVIKSRIQANMRRDFL